MANNEQGFIGVRVGEDAKGLLAREAKARGVSLTAHVKQILGGDIPTEDDKKAAVKNRENSNWQEIVEQLEGLEKQKASLEALIEERTTGFFAPREPYSLRLSLQACKRAMSDLQEELEALLPEEDVTEVKEAQAREEW